MIKFLIFSLIHISFLFAQEVNEFDLNSICNKKISITDSKIMSFDLGHNEDKLYVYDKGFCTHFLDQQFKINMDSFFKKINIGVIPKQEKECLTLGSQLPNPPSSLFSEPKEKWKVHLYVKHSALKYFNSDVTFKTTNYNVELKDYSWVERTLSEFDYEAEQEQQPFPPFHNLNKYSNTYMVGIEKDGNEFFLSVARARYSQPGNIVINDREIVLNENNTHQYSIELGFAKHFTLFETNQGSIDYVPALSSGIMLGSNRSADIEIGQSLDEAYVYKSHYGREGYGGSLTNRLEFTSKNKRLKVYYENRLSDYVMNHSFLDGTEAYNLGYVENIFGIKYTIFNSKDKPKH